MPSLQIRELPPPVYERLKLDAERAHRSLAQQAIVELKKAQGADDSRRHAALKRISEMERIEFPDDLCIADLIREDRDSR